MNYYTMTTPGNFGELFNIHKRRNTPCSISLLLAVLISESFFGVLQKRKTISCSTRLFEEKTFRNMLLEFFSLPIFLLRLGGVWDWESAAKNRTVRLLRKIYCFLGRYVAIYPTIFLYVMHLTVEKTDVVVRFV